MILLKAPNDRKKSILGILLDKLIGSADKRGDSKLFDKELKSKVCSHLERYCEIESDGFSDDEKGLKKEKLLSLFMIVKIRPIFISRGTGKSLLRTEQKSSFRIASPSLCAPIL